jgi:hypothetical protein
VAVDTLIKKNMPIPQDPEDHYTSRPNQERIVGSCSFWEERGLVSRGA